MLLLINGTYEVVDVAATSSMSTVYKTRHVRLGTPWAIKQIKKGIIPGYQRNLI